MVLYGGALANPLMLGTAALASAVSFLLAGRLNHAYVDSLERSLTQHAGRSRFPDASDANPRRDWPVTAGLPTTRDLTVRAEPPPPPPWLGESAARQWIDLTSGDAERIRNSLRNGPALERPLLPYVIPLLARKSIAPVVGSP